MKKQDVKKLILSRETLVRLESPDLRQILGGGGWSDDSVCPTVTSNKCP